jgi:hypothetical protein
MKISIEEKRELAEKGILVNENSIKAKNIDIYYFRNRISSVEIDGLFDYKNIKRLIVKYPDSEWVSLVLDKQINRSYFTFSGNHEKIHEKIKELIQKLNIVTYLNITERGESGSVTIETATDRDETNIERIRIDYVLNTIENVLLNFIYRNETKKVITEVLNIPNLDKISPFIQSLSLESRITKGIDQELVEFINTFNQPFYLTCTNNGCIYRPTTLTDEFLYFNGKIYPISISMKDTYPKIASFLPEEIRRVLNKFSGIDTAIIIRAFTKKEYEKVLPKALTVLSKLIPLVPDYLSFELEWFRTRDIKIRGSYEKLGTALNLLFRPEGSILLPLTMYIYDERHKLLSIYKPEQSNELTNRLLNALKKFLGTDKIAVYSENLQNQENDEILYYVLKYENYYVVASRELLPTVIYNLPKHV